MSYSILQESKETIGNAITQLWSHPFLHSALLNGCDRDWVMAFLLVSLHFEGWSMTGHP